MPDAAVRTHAGARSAAPARRLDPAVRGRLRQDLLFRGVVLALSLLATVPLVLILAFIVVRGASSINWAFLTELPRPIGETGWGIANGIVGTFLIIVLGTIVSVPLGVIAGIFLSESGKTRLGAVARLSIETLMGIPSIVIGIVAYVWIVRPMGHFSALSGGLAIAMIMLPVIALSTEETLRLIPVTLREAALALGVSYTGTILKVVLPAGMSGIVTGILLAVARGAGETAPLLFTAFGNPFMNINILKPVESLPQTIFYYATSPYPEWHSLAWGAAFVLLVIVLTLNVLTKLVTSRWKIQF
jgi:phosphate transport system permease protein